MWRYLVGVLAGVLLVAGGILWWRSTAVAGHGLPVAPPVEGQSIAAPESSVPEPPAATEKTREERRLSRVDHDKDGRVSRDEFLAMRRRNFDKLDANHDGALSFEEYATKAVERFAVADKDKTRILSPAEFATTRIVRKAVTSHCPTAKPAKEEEEEG